MLYEIDTLITGLNKAELYNISITSLASGATGDIGSTGYYYCKAEMNNLFYRSIKQETGPSGIYDLYSSSDVYTSGLSILPANVSDVFSNLISYEINSDISNPGSIVYYTNINTMKLEKLDINTHIKVLKSSYNL